MSTNAPLETLRPLMQQALLDDDVWSSLDGIEELLAYYYLGHRGCLGYTDAELEAYLALRDIPLPTNPDDGIMRKPEATLCYINDSGAPLYSGAYFTTQDLATQWGDDWDDYPYQYNAGEPYSAGKYVFFDGRVENIPADWNIDGTPKWNIIKITFVAPPDSVFPCDMEGEYSVSDINRKGQVPWMTFPRRGAERGDCTMMAGAPISRFINWVVMYGGVIRSVETNE